MLAGRRVTARVVMRTMKRITTTREKRKMERREMVPGLEMADSGVPFSMSTEREEEEEEEIEEIEADGV